MRVKVLHVVKAWDMRKKHALREGIRAAKLKRGQCLVAFNRALDMARIIDSEGGVHDYYADKGEQFDLQAVRGRMERAMFVDLDVGKHDSVAGVAQLRAA